MGVFLNQSGIQRKSQTEADKGGTMTPVSGLLIFSGLMLYVTSDKSCDKSMKDAVKSYAERVGSSDITICSEYTEIECDQDYAPYLLEKRPTIYCDRDVKCDYLTILFFGKYDDCNSTSLLWFYYNVRRADLKCGFTGQSGDEMAIYSKPKNSEAPAIHAFFLYCQRECFQNFDCCGEKERDNFDVKAFAKLKKLDNPVAGKYFRVTANGQLMNSTSYTEGAKKGKCSNN